MPTSAYKNAVNEPRSSAYFLPGWRVMVELNVMMRNEATAKPENTIAIASSTGLPTRSSSLIGFGLQAPLSA